MNQPPERRIGYVKPVLVEVPAVDDQFSELVMVLVVAGCLADDPDPLGDDRDRDPGPDDSQDKQAVPLQPGNQDLL